MLATSAFAAEAVIGNASNSSHVLDEMKVLDVTIAVVEKGGYQANVHQQFTLDPRADDWLVVDSGDFSGTSLYAYGEEIAARVSDILDGRFLVQYAERNGIDTSNGLDYTLWFITEDAANFLQANQNLITVFDTSVDVDDNIGSEHLGDDK